MNCLPEILKAGVIETLLIPQWLNKYRTILIKGYVSYITSNG